MLLLAALLLYLAYVNIAAYRAFAADKQFAINKEQRTPEAILLRWARLGGWGGAKLAQHRLRHKSYKQPFGSKLNQIGMIQATCAVLFLGVLAALSVVPNGSDFVIPAQTVRAAPQAAPPADGSLLISLRPPALRPVAW